MFDPLIQSFERIGPLRAEDKELLHQLFQPCSLKKGEYFLEEGKPSNKLGFLVKGLVYYFVYKNDEVAITDFTKEGEFVSEYHTFSHQGTAIHNIRAIEDCELLVLDYDGLQTFYNQIPTGNKIGRIVLEHRFSVIVTQLLSLYMHNPGERYLNFTQNYNDLAQRIPQYLIAAFIGVKPQSLSRIRNRITKGLC